MNNCETCRCNKICDHNIFAFENCRNFIPEVSIPTEFEGATLIINLGTEQGKIRTFGWKKEIEGKLYGGYEILREGHEADDIYNLIPVFAKSINEVEKEVSKNVDNKHFIQKIPDPDKFKRMPGKFVWVSDDEDSKG